MEESSLKEWLCWDDLLEVKGSFSGFCLDIKLGVFREKSRLREVRLDDGKVIFICDSTQTFIEKNGNHETWAELMHPKTYSYDPNSFDLFEDPAGNIVFDAGRVSGVIRVSHS